MKGLGLFILLLFAFKPGHACNCRIKHDFIWEFLIEYDVVFKGNVVRIDTINYKKIILFKVIDPYKNIEKKEIEVITNMGGRDCGIYDIKVGETWLIFGHIRFGKVFTSWCTYSCKSTSEPYNDILEKINSLIKSVNKEITIKHDRMMAKGTLNNKGLTGKWIIKNKRCNTIETRYYSENAVLDSSITMKRKRIVGDVIVYKDSTVTRNFNLRGNVYRKRTYIQLLKEDKAVWIERYVDYYNNGAIKRKYENSYYYDLYGNFIN